MHLRTVMRSVHHDIYVRMNEYRHFNVILIIFLESVSNNMDIIKFSEYVKGNMVMPRMK